MPELYEIQQWLIQSTQDDWAAVDETGPSFHDTWEKSTTPSDRGWELHHGSHRAVLVYRRNVSLTVAYGLPEKVIDHGRRESPEWNAIFPDSRPLDIELADVFWNGALIDRCAVTHVDGGRAILPWPTARVREADGRFEWEVTSFQVALARIAHESRGLSYELDEYLRRAGFTVVG